MLQCVTTLFLKLTSFHLYMLTSLSMFCCEWSVSYAVSKVTSFNRCHCNYHHMLKQVSTLKMERASTLFAEIIQTDSTHVYDRVLIINDSLQAWSRSADVSAESTANKAKDGLGTKQKEITWVCTGVFQCVLLSLTAVPMRYHQIQRCQMHGNCCNVVSHLFSCWLLLMLQLERVSGEESKQRCAKAG